MVGEAEEEDPDGGGKADADSPVSQMDSETRVCWPPFTVTLPFRASLAGEAAVVDLLVATGAVGYPRS